MTFNYGIIGNCKTAALVSREGSIDWCCFPKFDSPSVFAKLLDSKRGGSCGIVPIGRYRIDQNYVSKTNILETTFSRKNDEFRVYDFFPRYRYGEKIEKLHQIVRYIRVVRGSPKVRVVFSPRFDYARGRTIVKIQDDHITASRKGENLLLYSDLDLQVIMKSKSVKLSSEHFVVLSYNQRFRPSVRMVKALFSKTSSYWRDFVRFSTLPRYYKPAVIRSVLALKLLTHRDGAVLAAPTTSLPEVIGGSRNWDYRYCWLRDASFTIDAFTKICHFDEAENFIEWLTRICRRSRKDIQIVYRMDGDRGLKERVLPHLRGYRNSRPVRVGNHAWLQRQLDVYGEVVEAFYLFFHHYNYAELEPKHWKVIEKMVDLVARQWEQPDSGLWEFRGIKKHFTFSKLMCWVALDRAVKMARRRKSVSQLRQWAKVRDSIRQSIMGNAWSQKLKSFTQSYGEDALDASNLLMVYFGFLPATHPKMKRTISAALKHLTRNGFAYRYLVKDDFGFPKNSFTVCTFWLVDALYLSGERDLARKLFKNILNNGNYLGLFSEDIDPDTLELTGNFPQAYTHLAIINTATLLSTGQLRRPPCTIHFEMLQD